MHKHQEGVYNVLYFDKHGRHLREKDLIRTNLHDAIEAGKSHASKSAELSSFIVKRNVYNSVDHT